MAVKCLITFTIVSFLGIVCAREIKLTSKLKADPGIFISLETLRRLEAKAKNGTEGITTITSSENSVDVDDTVISTTSIPDIENPVSNEPDEVNETTISDIENQTNQPTNSNDTKTDASLDKPVTSTPNHPDTNQQYYPNEASSQQALLAYQKIKWPVPQYPYDWANQNYYQPNQFQQLRNGAATNQQKFGCHQMNPALYNQRVLYYNDPQPFSINNQITFDPNQHYQQTFIVQHPYPINHPSNPRMN